MILSEQKREKDERRARARKRERESSLGITYTTVVRDDVNT